MRKRRRDISTRIGEFLRRYGRKRPTQGDPNDRKHDRKLEAQLKRMSPEELDELLRDELDSDGK